MSGCVLWSRRAGGGETFFLRHGRAGPWPECNFGIIFRCTRAAGPVQPWTLHHGKNHICVADAVRSHSLAKLRPGEIFATALSAREAFLSSQRHVELQPACRNSPQHCQFRRFSCQVMKLCLVVFFYTSSHYSRL